MRSLFFLLASIVMSLSATAQSVGNAFYIYRNDGGFNAFFRDEVDSITYSCYDTDSIFYDEIVTQLVYTPDSVYRIPIAAIDSVGFVQPETIYKEDAKPLVGALFDYLIKADSLLLTFDASLPSSLLPIVGDKLVATALTDKLPLGFAGTVRLVELTADGYLVTCDSLALEDAVERFYGVAELVTYRDNSRSRGYLSHRAVVSEQTKPVHVNLPRIQLPLDLTAVIKPKKVYDIEGSARADITIDPVLTGRVTYVVDSRLGFSHYNIHAILDAETETKVDFAGGVTKDDFLELLFDKDVPMPWGYPLYVAFGPQFELSGEMALGTTIYANFRHTSDITFYPLATAVAPGLSKLFNTESHTTKMTHFDAEWAYIAGRAEAKLFVKGRLGLPFGKHEVGWVGAEFEIGAKCDAELNVDFEALSNAEKGTGLYETLKDSKIEVMPYWGAVGKLAAAKDRFEFKFIGRDDYSFWGQKWEWDLLPKFSDTETMVSDGFNADVSANITNDCIIPYTVGFSLFDENNNRIGDPHWYEQKFWTRNSFNFPFEMTFTDLSLNKKYMVYPTLRFFGFNLLASPSAEISIDIAPIADGSDIFSSRSALLKGHVEGKKEHLGGNVALGFIYGTDSQLESSDSKRVIAQCDSNYNFTATIDDLSGGRTYYYKAFLYGNGKYYYSDNALQFTTPLPVEIPTVTTTTAQYRPTDHPQHFIYKDNPYEFKYDVVTVVKLTDDEGVENWGYVYEGPYEGDKKSRISLKGAPYEYEDTRFAFYRNGSPTEHTARLYPFVKYSGDDEYYYGEPVDYPLVYPDTSTVELTGCSTNDVVTRENVEYNGVTYDYCSTFILDYNATGAYWITVGAEETGDGWNGWDNNLPARERAKAADGSNRLTINYYYNRKVLEGEYMLRIKGTDGQHGTSCTSSKSVRLKHNGKSFTGCELIQ